MENKSIKQSVIEKLTLIANQEEGVALTNEEADFIDITSLDDATILAEREVHDGH